MTWKLINTAPKHEDHRNDDQAWGPMIRLRNAEYSAKGHWRHDRSGYQVAFGQEIHRMGRWEDEYDHPLAFVPTEWSEIDG